MGSCELCGDSESLLVETRIPKSATEAVLAFVCEDCLDDVPKTKPDGGYTKGPQIWWQMEGRERYEEHGRDSATYPSPPRF
jgi:hypothetical protein